MINTLLKSCAYCAMNYSIEATASLCLRVVNYVMGTSNPKKFTITSLSDPLPLSQRSVNTSITPSRSIFLDIKKIEINSIDEIQQLIDFIEKPENQDSLSQIETISFQPSEEIQLEIFKRFLSLFIEKLPYLKMKTLHVRNIKFFNKCVYREDIHSMIRNGSSEKQFNLLIFDMSLGDWLDNKNLCFQLQDLFDVIQIKHKIGPVPLFLLSFLYALKRPY